MKLKVTASFEIGVKSSGFDGRAIWRFKPLQRPDLLVTQISLRNFVNEITTGTISVQAPRSQTDLTAILMTTEKVRIILNVLLLEDDDKTVISTLKRKFVVTTVKGKFDFNSEQLTFNVVPLLVDNGNTRVTTTSITDEEVKIIASEVQNSTDIPKAKAIFNGFVKVFAGRGITVYAQEIVPLNLQNEFQPEQLQGDLFVLFRDFMYSSYRGFANFPFVIEFKDTNIFIHRLVKPVTTGRIELFYGPSFNVKPIQRIYEQINIDSVLFAPGLGVSKSVTEGIDSLGKTSSQEITVEFGQGFVSSAKPSNFETANYHGLYTLLVLLMARNLQVRVLGQDIELLSYVHINSKIKIDRFKDNTKAIDDPLFNNRNFIVVGVEHHIDNSGWFTDLRLIPTDLIPVIQKQERSRSVSIRTIEPRTVGRTTVDYIRQEETFTSV